MYSQRGPHTSHYRSGKHGTYFASQFLPREHRYIRSEAISSVSVGGFPIEPQPVYRIPIIATRLGVVLVVKFNLVLIIF